MMDIKEDDLVMMLTSYKLGQITLTEGKAPVRCFVLTVMGTNPMGEDTKHVILVHPEFISKFLHGLNLCINKHFSEWVE
jgi:hypothetical protein